MATPVRSTPVSSTMIFLPLALISLGSFAVSPGIVVSSLSVRIVTPDMSTLLWSPEATNVEDTSIRFVTTELTLPAASVCVTEMISSPSRKFRPAAFAGILNDQTPLATVVVFPVAGMVYPLPLNEIATVAPSSPVPEIVKPAVFSVTSMTSSTATVSIVATPATPPDVYAVKPVLSVPSRENELASTLVIV